MATAVEHIVWDWNGTLFADGPALIDSTIDAFRALGLPPITRTDYQAKHRQPISAFYDALLGRTLTAAEQAALDRQFQRAYLSRRDAIALNPEAERTMRQWLARRRSQSLLSMYPHDRLLPLVEHFGIDRYFTAVDGLRDTETRNKAPHLRRHLARLDADPARVLLVGDSVDDAIAARECGVACVLYHAGDDALHTMDHFTPLGVPVVGSLAEAVSAAVDGERWVGVAAE
ncbi:HAD family hydrolase [Actinokineospora sp. NBRC 105648]|uniref:HAD family hydrolase n=1 Tax=Actinokineospora sp. NBRC 105648 TaxID=3032206 RepID=UPI0024A27362|nr:HAD family hydrolase [Actinokineospora sp. NBRC 105648]GLZ37106.1 phosphatase [Actinokineospora sp. NBRC 105648]